MPDHYPRERYHAELAAVKRVVHGHRSIIYDTDGQTLGLRVMMDIPQELWLWEDVGLGWGRHWPQESTTLALALLDRALTADRVGVCDEWHRPLVCNPWAYRLAWCFAEAFIVPCETWVFRVDLDFVRRWALVSRAAWDGPIVNLRQLTPAERFPAAMYP